MFGDIVALQRWIYGALTADLDLFAADRSWLTLMAMLPAGVVFGAVHAMTPGHGKSILASYLLGSRLAALRAFLVAAVLAVTHVGTAVLIAVLALPLVRRTLVGAGEAPAAEYLSRGLLIAIGLWLILRAWRGRSHLHGERLGGRFCRRPGAMSADPHRHVLRPWARRPGGGTDLRSRHGCRCAGHACLRGTGDDPWRGAGRSGSWSGLVRRAKRSVACWTPWRDVWSLCSPGVSSEPEGT